MLYAGTKGLASGEEFSGQQMELACGTSGLVAFSGTRDSWFSLEMLTCYEGCSLTWAVSSCPCLHFSPAHPVTLLEHSCVWRGADTKHHRCLSSWLPSALQISWWCLHSHAVGADSPWTCRRHSRVSARIRTWPPDYSRHLVKGDTVKVS